METETTADILREIRKEKKRKRDKHYRDRHREERNAKTREYHKLHPLKNLYYVMKQRCGITKGASQEHLKWYAKRGISISSEWDTAEKFEAWALSNGWKPGLQIDRINNEGNYSPENCRFVTPKINSRNRRTTRWVTFKGQTMSLAELAERTGVKRQTISYRLNNGLTTEEAISCAI